MSRFKVKNRFLRKIESALQQFNRFLGHQPMSRFIGMQTVFQKVFFLNSAGIITKGAVEIQAGNIVLLRQYPWSLYQRSQFFHKLCIATLRCHEILIARFLNNHGEGKANEWVTQV